MKVLMFGWEFPPHIGGGLGTASSGLTEGLTGHEVEIAFVMPGRGKYHKTSYVQFIDSTDFRFNNGEADGSKDLKIEAIDSILMPYMTEESYKKNLKEVTVKSGRGFGSPLVEFSGYYGPDIFSEVYRYSQVARTIAVQHQPYDIIHAHDWITIPAGIQARLATGKPLILHIHSLESDRSGIHGNQHIYNIERHGMQAADHIIAVSHYTRKKIVRDYGISERKVSVVHNAVSHSKSLTDYNSIKDPSKKYVLFLGRITFQKGPGYFIEASRRVFSRAPDTHFIMAGSGDMLPHMIEKVASLRIGKNFLFTGFLKVRDVEKAYAMSDLYVMPSVSDPFGISALEATLHGVPVIISKQSGVTEVLSHCLKVDFWNVKDLANKILGVLKYPTLRDGMIRNSEKELQNITWKNAAEKVIAVYHRSLGG